MFSALPESLYRGLFRLTASFIAWVCIVGLLLPSHAAARQQELQVPPRGDQPEAWLVTYSPGSLYWQRFGHNAIWIRDRSMGIDHAFNFGFFDFNQERFLARFVQGRMLYFSAARPVHQEFAEYRTENRTISALKLNLAEAQVVRLRDRLVEQVQLENRDYLYDYYLDNCSTRVRDALDFAFDGALSRQTKAQPAGQNFRAQTRRLVSGNFWYYLGLETALALPVDREITRWEEMFLPSVVADVVQAAKIDGAAMVTEHLLIFEGSLSPPPDKAVSLWPRYLLFSLLATALVLLVGRLAGPVMSGGLSMAWLLLNGTAGLVLLALWVLTDHRVAGPNANLMLLNPLFLIGLWPFVRRPVAILMGLGLVVSLAVVLWPGGQYIVDVLVFAAPLNAACAAWLWRPEHGHADA